ncbi:hypothetical protein MKZ38_006219 [Zalerion maritima]|uniref:Methyltransferase type 11 domain-containing protein n=1 Tax=Zalerion maritima TaxID=339359 RepID=A0AAD5RVL1_9PEZI|nr:hypothetical protein MKZ38_006219 [Zalerion maritima]
MSSGQGKGYCSSVPDEGGEVVDGGCSRTATGPNPPTVAVKRALVPSTPATPPLTRPLKGGDENSGFGPRLPGLQPASGGVSQGPRDGGSTASSSTVPENKLSRVTHITAQAAELKAVTNKSAAETGGGERREVAHLPREAAAKSHADDVKGDVESITGTGTTSESGNDQAASEYEATHVHSVYSSIAFHFSSTRHKPWPRVSTFLERVAPASIGIDVGCGNGKYIGVNKNVWVVGSDTCRELIACAQDRLRKEPLGGEASVQADGLALPFRAGMADFAICIAVLHHLSTRERRVEGVGAILDCLRPGQDGGGQALLYVWALEQEGSRRGWQEGGEQDLLVPWVMKGKKKKDQAKDEEGKGEDATYRRYYHLYAKGELEEDVRMAQGRVVESGYEKDNWWVVCEKGG